MLCRGSDELKHIEKINLNVIPDRIPIWHILLY